MGGVDRIRVDVQVVGVKCSRNCEAWVVNGGNWERGRLSQLPLHSMNENNYYVTVIKNGCGFSYQII